MGNLISGQPAFLAYIGSSPVTLASSAFDVSATIVYGLESGNVKSYQQGRASFLNTKTTIDPGTGFQVNPGANITLSDSIYTGFGVTALTPPTTSLQLWLKSDTGLTLDTTGTTTVAAWADQSGNSRNATQSTKGSQPTVVTNAINNKPVIRFDGVDDFMTGVASNTGNSVTALMVCRKTAAGGNFYGVLALATSSVIDSASAQTAIAITNTPTGLTTYRNNVADNEVSVSTNIPLLVTVTYDGTNGVIDVNNSSQSFASTGNFNYNRYTIANRDNGVVATTPIDVGELLIYNSADSTNITAAKNYLKQVWGL